MEPRSRERGNPLAVARAGDAAEASMEPRSRERGNKGRTLINATQASQTFSVPKLPGTIKLDNSNVNAFEQIHPGGEDLLDEVADIINTYALTPRDRTALRNSPSLASLAISSAAAFGLGLLLHRLLRRLIRRRSTNSRPGPQVDFHAV